MISNQILQETLDGIFKISGVILCATDFHGKVMAFTGEDAITDETMVGAFIDSIAESQVIAGNQYFKVFDEKRLEYILIAQGESENVYTVGKLAVFQIEKLLGAYKERFDKENFVKNLLLDNLLLVDIFNRAKKLNIDVEVPRVAYLIESHNGREENLIEHVNELESTLSTDFVAAVDEKSVVLVTEIEGKKTQEDFIQHAKNVRKKLMDQGIEECRIAIGTVAKGIKDVSRSYKEAQIALDVDKIFYEERPVVAYSQLGIGRLIYQLPLPLCHMFIREVFGDYSPDTLDDETLATINKFFENNLNISETSRQLFIHRNTLVYRLDKIQKTTHLDLRNFDDAITFKIALMVVKYMKHMDIRAN